jgi:RNA polymerase sigma factor (sigma-70 family)
LCREAIPDRNEQIRLGRAIRAWQDHPEGAENAPAPVIRRGKRALDRLVNGNIRLAINLARKVPRGRMELDDLIQIAIEGLIGGCRRYDPSRGYTLATYARWWIVQALLRGKQHETAMYVPVETIHINSKATTALMRLSERLGRQPSLVELAAELENRWSPERLGRVLKQVHASRCASLDATAGSDSDRPLVDFIALATPADEPQQQLLEADRIEQVQQFLCSLEPIDRQLLISASGEGETLKDLAAANGAKVFQLSKRRKAVIRKAQHKLRELAA